MFKILQTDKLIGREKEVQEIFEVLIQRRKISPHSMRENPRIENFNSVIKYPINTEKSEKLLKKNQYSFVVERRSNKLSIKFEIELLFNVKVVSVNTSIRMPKRRRLRSPNNGYKIAIVKLAPESSIKLFEEN